jgi:hypothetical protein
MAGLLSFWSYLSPPSPERLYIADFYLANPPLLHKTHMSRDVRNLFNDLGVVRPEKSFVSYPSAPLLFQRMDEVQRQAFRTITGKGLIDLAGLQQGLIKPTTQGRDLFATQFVPLLDESESKIAHFVANSFAPMEQEISGLRRSTGLRRMSR